MVSRIWCWTHSNGTWNTTWLQWETDDRKSRRVHPLDFLRGWHFVSVSFPAVDPVAPTMLELVDNSQQVRSTTIDSDGPTLHESEILSQPQEG